MQVLLIVFKLALAAKETVVMLYNEILSSGVKLFKTKLFTAAIVCVSPTWFFDIWYFALLPLRGKLHCGLTLSCSSQLFDRSTHKPLHNPLFCKWKKIQDTWQKSYTPQNTWTFFSFSAVQKKNTTNEIKDMYEFNPEQILPAYSQEL